MRIRRLLMAMLFAAGGTEMSLPVMAGPLHHRRGVVRYRTSQYGMRVLRVRRLAYQPLSGTVGTAIPPRVARFMGYPYNVPGYRYEYADACFLRVGGPFGPGPSAGPCPFGLDKPF